MPDLSNLLKARKENLKKNFIVGIIISSFLFSALICLGYSTYKSQNVNKQSIGIRMTK